MRIPALLPLPGLGSFEFLKTLTNECPPSVFDNDAMGLVLDIMWRKHVRHFFLADLALYIGMYILWIVFVDSTSSSTSRISDSWSDTTTVGFGVTLVVLNTVFAVKELIQSGWGLSSDHFRQIWNIADFLCIIFVYATTTMTMIQGTGRGSVTLGVLGSLVLTMKLLSYLRGFQDTGESCFPVFHGNLVRVVYSILFTAKLQNVPWQLLCFDRLAYFSLEKKLSRRERICSRYVLHRDRVYCVIQTPFW